MITLKPLWHVVVLSLGLVVGQAIAAHAAGFIKWEAANQGLQLGNGSGVTEIASGAQGVVYALVDGSGLYKSTNSGQSWAALKGNAPPLQAPYTVAVSPANGVFVGVSTPGGGLWRSDDGGQNWTKVGELANGMASDDVEAIAFTPGNPQLILVGHRDGRQISVSADGGKTWKTRDLGLAVKQQLPLAIDNNKWVVASRAGGALRVTDDAGGQWQNGEGGTDYFGGPLPIVQTGDYLFQSRHHGFVKSTDDGKAWQYVMEQHTRVVGVAGPYVFRENRQGIRGTDDRIFTIEMSDNYGQSWSDVTQGLQLAVPEKVRPNLIISNQVDPFAHVRVATAWSSAPDGNTVFLGLGKAGLYRGRLLWTPQGPRVVAPGITPRSVVEGDDKAKATVSVVVSPRRGALQKVYADLSVLGLPDLELFDDGQHGDGEAGDKNYANSFLVPGNMAASEKTIGVVAQDAAGHLNSNQLRLLVASPSDRLIVWDGDKFSGGFGWVSPPKPLNSFQAQTEEAHSGKVAMEFHGEGGGYIGGGWNWHGYYPANAGTDVTAFRNLCFWMKVDGEAKPDTLNVSLVASSDTTATKAVEVSGYGDKLLDGNWHEVVIPLQDMLEQGANFNFSKVWMMNVNTWSPTPRNFSIYIDDLGFSNQRVRSRLEWVSLPEARQPGALGNEVIPVSAQIDIKAPGQPISPYIYGAAMSDRKAAQEMGLTALRAGGNPVSAVNWKHGFGSKGADWFFQNEGTETPPEKNWLLTFHGENKKAGLGTYLTLPMMGRVAKDGTSAAFDTHKYPDQESWAGKTQSTDRLPDAGNGREFVKGGDGQPLKDKDGKPVLRDVEPDPNDTSVEMSPEEQTQMLEFMVKNMGYGTADKGGVPFVALDNEPGIWHSTHRGMHPKGASYDEMWERTRTYSTLLKKIDPQVKIAGPNAWGWTDYFLSGLDQQMVNQGKGTWENPPDFAAHGSVPFTVWWLKKLKEHEQQTGQKLVDVLDWHFYPQTGIYMSGQTNDPQIMEARVQETRVLWDPTWKDPSWMAGDANGAKVEGHLQILRLMKKWIAENNPGMGTAIGEYNFGGEGDVSGGVAQAELLGIFAREGLDHAYYWFAPAPNSSTYFAFKMFRNPDGRHTVFGDQYLPAMVSMPDDVSVHAARDSKSGRLTFILVNKRATKGTRVNLKLNAPLPAQDATLYEYSAADRYAIGQLPTQKVQGDSINVNLPPLSIVRFDVKQ